jgi:methyl-accepting chemotaxis protein
MKHAKGAFGIAILLNLAWIAWSTFLPPTADPRLAALLLVGPSFGSIVVYQLYLGSRGQFLTQRDIDSVYYLGFLITLMVLAAAAYQVAGYHNAKPVEGRQLISSIGLKFALGLLATGYGLFGRITLQSKLIAPDDATSAIESYVDGIGRLNDRISTSTSEIEKLVDEVLKNASRTSKQAGAAVIATLSEELEPTARRLSDAIAQLNEVAQSLGTGPMRSLSELTEGVSTGFEALGQKIPSVTERLGSLATFATEAATAQSDLAQAATTTGESIKAAEQAISSVELALAPVAEQVQGLADSVRKANTVMRKTPEVAERLGVGFGRVVDAMQAINDQAKGLAAAMEAYERALQVPSVEALDRSLANAAAKASVAAEALDGLGRKASAVGTVFASDIGANAKHIRELAGEMTTTSEQLGRAMERLAIAIRDAATQVAQ